MQQIQSGGALASAYMYSRCQRSAADSEVSRGRRGDAK
jgi:hypothetical protein